MQELIISKSYYIKCITVSDRLNAIVYCEDMGYRVDENKMGKSKSKKQSGFNYILLQKGLMWGMSEKDAIGYITKYGFEPITIPVEYTIQMPVWKQCMYELSPYVRVELFGNNSKLEDILKKYISG